MLQLYVILPGTLIIVTVQAKTSLVHTSKFTILEVHNFPYERHTELKFTLLIEQTSLYDC